MKIYAKKFDLSTIIVLYLPTECV